MREMAEVPIKTEKKADDTSITPAETEEAKLVRVIQRVRAHSLCPEKSEAQGAHTDCYSTQEYPSNAADEFEINGLELPALDLEQYEPNIKEDTGVADESKGSIHYALIGAGQCGGRLVKSFYDLGYKKVLAVDTTRSDLDSLDIPPSQKFLMGTGEEGTGRDAERGAKAIQPHRQDILHLAL